MSEKPQSIHVGSFVQPRVHPSRQHEITAHGRVEAIEKFTDDQSTRIWIIVKWFDAEGFPGRDGSRHAAAELVLMDDETANLQTETSS